MMTFLKRNLVVFSISFSLLSSPVQMTVAKTDWSSSASEKGWKEFELNTTKDGRKIRVACGRAGIGEPPANKDFLSSRTVAFNDALLNIQKRFSEFEGKKIQVQISNALQKGFGIDDKTKMIINPKKTKIRCLKKNV